MELSNLSVDRIIIHQVYQRDVDGNKTPPLKSNEYTRFDASAMDAFRQRVVDALGEGGKSVEMEIVDQREGHVPRIIERMPHENDDEFVESSYELARLLTECQTRRSTPGGIVVVFSGTCGSQSFPIVGLIKAEIHSGYEKRSSPHSDEISLKFVEELLMTPGNRLYKTAAFLSVKEPKTDAGSMNESWRVLVSDYQISHVDGKAAAQYFYRDFLGCDYPETSARTTKRFYDAASAFIADLDVSETERTDLFNALTTFLRAERSDLVEPLEFANRYLDADGKDEFQESLESAAVPTTAFARDTTHIENRLKYRSVQFRSKIKITGPSDQFRDMVEILPIQGEKDENGESAEWTQVIVKDRITEQQ